MAAFGALFTAAVAWALGRILFRRLGISLKGGEHDLLAGVTGASLLSLAVFVLCAVHLVWTPVFLAFAAVFFFVKRREPAGSLAPLPDPLKYMFLTAFVFYGVVYLSNSLAPEHSPDGMAYHLAIVGRYFGHHGFESITTNMYANLSQGMEMLFLFAFAFGRHSAAATVHCLFLLALPFLMVSYGRRVGHPWAGGCAAMLVYLSPLAGIDGSSAYNDVALATVAFAMFYLLEIWREERDDRLLIPIGLLAGFSFAMKYTGFPALLYAAIVLWRRDFSRVTLRRLFVPAAVIALPWLVKNWLVIGNPVSPFFNRIFPNPYVHVSFEDTYRQLMRTYLLPSLKPIAWIVTVSGRLGGQVGPLFLLAPLALFGLRSRVGRACLLAAALFLIPYPANIGARFLIPALPFVAFGIALAVEPIGVASKPVFALLIAAAAILAWPRTIERYSVPAGNWYIGHVPWKAALRMVPEDKFLWQYAPEYRLAMQINEAVPPDQRVWSTLGLAEAWTKAGILVNYYSAQGEAIEDILQTPVIEAFQPLLDFRFTFPRRKVSHLRVVQTAASGDSVWSIGEVRFTRSEQEGDVEINPVRADAKPFPWDIGLALDRNPVTRWRSWQSLYPGMHVDFDFEGAAALDRVDLYCSYDEQKLEMHLEGAGPGQDVKLEKIGITARQDLRRLATATVKARGIGYLLIGSDYLTAADMRQDPQRWGLTTVFEHDGIRLYKIQ